MTVKFRLILPAVLFLCTPALAVEPVDIGSRLEPIVDDCLIDKLDGAALRLHSPTPREIVLKFDRPWEGPYSSYCTVLKDGDCYRMYYRGLPEARHALDTEVTCYAESDDGVHWTKPNLMLFEVHGTKQNNVVLARHPACTNLAPVLDANPDALPSQRYKALGGGQESGLIALASPDGIHWKELRKKPVMAFGFCGSKNVFDSENVSFWSVSEGCYVCYFRVYEEGNRVRWIARTTSRDFLNWSRPVSLGLDGKPRQQLYTSQFEPYVRAPHIYLGLPMRFFPGRRALSNEQLALLDTPKLYSNDCVDVTLISTRGGDELKRTFLEAFIRPGEDAFNWASRACCPAHGILQTSSNELSLYLEQHSGYPSAHLRRYTLRPDGFASVNAPYAGGEMITKPIRFTGDRLAINYSTSAAGGIRVEIQDADGKPIPGFALEECSEIVGDQFERTVNWRGGADVGTLTGRPIRLRFVLKDADLFAFRFPSKE
ncbi:MAG: hypothetical protein JW959_01485 [Pirellulales bacterium]|nr:hypothetical protein [Pirellulales bacterium]